MESTKDKLDVQVRWMIRRDLQEVLEIDRTSFAQFWREEDFLARLRIRNCIGMVSEIVVGAKVGRIVGQMLYALEKDRLHVLRFAVHPQFRHQRVGRQMAEKLIAKVVQQRRQEVYIEVRETNLDAHLFWRSCGLVAVDNVRGWFEDTGEDAIVFARRIEPEPVKQRWANSA